MRNVGLAAENKYNYDVGGLKTITGRHEPPPAQQARLSVSAAGSVEARRPGRTAARAIGARLGVDTQDDVIWEQSGRGCRRRADPAPARASNSPQIPTYARLN